MAIPYRLAAFLGRSALVALFLLMSLVAARAEETFTEGQLAIVAADGTRHAFTVELALTPGQRAQGLMNRRTMAADRGMLFSFGETRQVLMWMKNTLLTRQRLRPVRSPSAICERFWTTNRSMRFRLPRPIIGTLRRRC